MSRLRTAERTFVQVEQTVSALRAPLLTPRHQTRVCSYGTTPQFPLGNAAIFKEAGSLGAHIQQADNPLRGIFKSTTGPQTRQGQSLASRSLFCAWTYHFCPVQGPIKMEKDCLGHGRLRRHRDDVCGAFWQQPRSLA